MAKQKIRINDFDLFLKALKALNKLTVSSKFTINSEGLTIYGKNAFARGELTSNSVVSEKDPIEFCILDLAMFIKVLGTAYEVHQDDFSEIEMWFDFPFIKIESGKFKTKIATCKEEVIQNSVSQKVKTVLTPVFEFMTSTKQIKYVNSHSFIASDPDSARIYLSTEPTMENNTVYARIGNDANELNNSITLKFGMATSGTLGDRKLILNFDRLGIFNVVDSDEISIQLMDKNVLVNTINVYGDGDSSFKFVLYTSLLAN
jgi:hypothetical protein